MLASQTQAQAQPRSIVDRNRCGFILNFIRQMASIIVPPNTTIVQKKAINIVQLTLLNLVKEAPTPIFPTMQIETFNHAESTGDAQEKQAHSCELALAENKKFVDSRFGAHLFQPLNFDVPDPIEEGSRLIEYLVDPNTLTAEFNNVNELIDGLCSKHSTARTFQIILDKQ